MKRCLSLTLLAVITCLITLAARVAALAPPEINRAAATTSRRYWIQTTLATIAATTVASAATPPSAFAINPKSRSEGYAVQRTDREWAYVISGAQYNILRKGGTERQKSSILNTFTSANNVGMYRCAGCSTPLFSSSVKFNSNTGWPSFSAALEALEVEEMDPLRATLDGREVRCGTCGGHMGDIFNDGWVYLGSSAAKTGKRYCIDGAALIFKPEGGSVDDDVYGDEPPKSKVINYEQSIYRT